MRKFITLFFFTLVISSMAFSQQMSDKQVVQYVRSAQQQGKTQKEISTELLRRGVTRQQVERIKERYEVESRKVDEYEHEEDPGRIRSAMTTDKEIEELNTPDARFEKNKQEARNIGGSGRRIYGRELFTSSKLSFEPNSNIATPIEYRLGPGDEVIIDIWGASENTIRETITPEGSILIPKLGPIYLSGKTINEATKYVRNELSKIYSGLLEDASLLKLSLGHIRTIRINIMGEVAVPGTYTLSSFSTVFHALYSAGGINPIGGMRNIQVVRGGKIIAVIDVYQYLMQGKTNDDIRLMEDDVILVPPYEALVNLSGKVRRPMFYEIKNGETIADLLKYAGNFSGDAYKNTIRLIRLSGREKQIYNVDEMDYATFKLNDEDFLSVEGVLNRFENMVEIRGAVYRDGLYQISNGVNTVKELIKKAEGLRGDAFLNRVQLQREHEDLTLEIIPIDLRGMLNGTVADIPLQRNDILYIPSIHELNEQRFLVIHGEVANPGTYIYAENMTVEDLIIQAGGLQEAASTARVDIARRIKDPKSTEANNSVGTIFSFDIKDNYTISGEKNFCLEPFDEVYVRRSPGYEVQKNVHISGEVLFSGTYALSKKNERLTDIIERAGGLTPDAYKKGVRLIRRMTDEEIRRKQDALRAVKASSDSISIKNMDLSTTYSVGVDLEKALAGPNSDFNLTLTEGDLLIIPEFINTVKINGAVMYPNTVSYKSGEKFKYYLNQAGGYGSLAKKKKAYVVYLNGTVARVKKNNSKIIEPGCEIIVPSKDPKNRMTTGEVLGITSTITSMAAVIAALVNVIK